MLMHELDTISSRIIEASINVHRELGPGLLESVYQTCLALELQGMGMSLRTEVAVPIIYKGKKLTQEFRMDLLVEEQVVVELKSVKEVQDIHKKQLLTYLKLAKKNFRFIDQL